MTYICLKPSPNPRGNNEFTSFIVPKPSLQICTFFLIIVTLNF